jgi:hypothetical protein
MPRVMISYRNIDGQREFAASLEKELANAGLETWIDFRDIPRLSKWEEEIFKGIIHSDCVILCLSPDYFESETCLFECYVARGYGKTLLPIIAPYEGNESVFALLSQHEATKGIDHLHVLEFHLQAIMGLPQSSAMLTQRLIKAITEPTPLDTDYDVYCSFKWQQGAFATQVADDLNNAGIKTFIHTRSIDVGTDWRQVQWNAQLRSKIHIVFMSPEVVQSPYIENEILVTRTQNNTPFIPVLAPDFRDEETKSKIRASFAKSKNLSVLNEIQWFIPNEDYSVFIDTLIDDIKQILSANAE